MLPKLRERRDPSKRSRIPQAATQDDRFPYGTHQFSTDLLDYLSFQFSQEFREQLLLGVCNVLIMLEEPLNTFRALAINCHLLRRASGFEGTRFELVECLRWAPARRGSESGYGLG
jgi:hypothetical protein